MVTGGGTAGHVFPALAVAEALVAAGHVPESIHYIGAERGVETRLLPATPFPHTFHDVSGFQRRVTKDNAGFVPRLARATQATIRQFTDERPGVVVSVGGYASMPAVIAARRLGIPVVVVSYDRRPGRASQLSARWARACAVSFEDSALPRAELTGAPIRQSVLAVDRVADRAAAREALGVPEERFLVAVMGGSLGSGVLNTAVAEYVCAHRGDTELAVRQVAGERFVDAIESADEGEAGLIHQIVGFESDMPSVYAAADLLIGRGGASTVHEVAATGTPAVLVPWAASAEDHQTGNVRWLSDDGAAVLLPESQVDHLGSEIERLRGDDTARAELAASARRKGEVHRSGAMASLIERVAVTSPSS